MFPNERLGSQGKKGTFFILDYNVSLTITMNLVSQSLCHHSYIGT